MSDQIKDLGREAKLKTKHILRIDNTKREMQHDDSIMAKIQNNAGFNPIKTLNAESSTVKQVLDQLPEKIQQLPHMIRHPKSAAKHKTAKTLATSEEPYISREDDECLSGAHEKLLRVGAANAMQDEPESLDDLRDTVNKLEDDREQKKVAWTTSRYVHRARVVKMCPDKYPVRSLCRWRDKDGELQGQYWSQWTVQFNLFFQRLFADPIVDSPKEPEWDRDLLLQHFERIVMASSPWQRWFMQIRKLQRWENPTRTATWFLVWSIVWYWNRVFSFLYCLAIYAICKKKMGNLNRENLCHSHNRAGDDDETPQTLGELIGRHGSEHWMDSMMSSVLPVVQPHVENWADWMEVLMNFGDDVQSTYLVLFLLVFMLALITCTSTDVCVRILTLSTIFGFFVHQPCSSRFSRYLQVLVPFHWILWNVPTHLEKSFCYLRIEAMGIQAVFPELKSTSPSEKVLLDTKLFETKSTAPLATADIFATGCTWNSLSGTIVIGVNDMRFVRRFPNKELWKRSFQELVEVKKGNGQTSVLKTTQNFLELSFGDGHSARLEHLKNKDELFNVVLAFSGLTWQQMAM
jgi:hypothetical protein